MLTKSYHWIQGYVRHVCRANPYESGVPPQGDASGKKFGIANEVKIFADLKDDRTITLFYDAKKGAGKTSEYISKGKEARANALKVLDEGGYPTIHKDCQGVLQVVQTDDGLVIEQDDKEYQRRIGQKGYSAIGSSKKLTADEIN